MAKKEDKVSKEKEERKETSSQTDTAQQQEKTQDAPPPQYSPTPQQAHTQGYQGSTQMPSPPPQYQPVAAGYPSALPYDQALGRPFILNTNDKGKQEKRESMPQTDEEQQRNMQNYPYSPNPLPYPQQQPYGYPGSSQMPQQPHYQSSPNTPGYSHFLPYSQVVYVQSPNHDSGPYRSRGQRKYTTESGPEYAGFTDVEVRRVFVRKEQVNEKKRIRLPVIKLIRKSS
ncbi:putative uncharacterized protein DDB_G0291608 [Argiope bruennichi]|uniref:putative uncharacterized protein DDB_G0291608 n=1 Tax=Argiope bruennichi TaxID=94029 RepID=UPI00249465C9|nr:putative uncharacterized protein DDB_G0291608 [Argiope bruennichi]